MSYKGSEPTTKEIISSLKSLQGHIDECENEMVSNRKEITKCKRKIKEHRHQITLWIQQYFKNPSDSQTEIKDLIAYLYWEGIVDQNSLEGCVPLPPEEIKRIVEERAEIYHLSEIFQTEIYEN